MIIAITGYIGVGKTTTANIFGTFGFEILEVDELGHLLLDRPEILEKLKKVFGLKILNRDLKVDRHKLAKVVFRDEGKLETLNSIVHPHLKEFIKQKLSEMSGNIVVDVALFTELDIEQLADMSILLSSDLLNIYERLSPQYTKEEIINVMNNQHLIKNPDITIDNNGTIEQLKSRVAQIIKNKNIPI